MLPSRIKEQDTVRSREFSKLVGSLSSLNLQQMHEPSLQVVRLSGRQEIQDLVSERIDQLGNAPERTLDV